MLYYQDTGEAFEREELLPSHGFLQYQGRSIFIPHLPGLPWNEQEAREANELLLVVPANGRNALKIIENKKERVGMRG